MIPCFRLVSQTDNKFAIDMDEDKCHISQNLKKPSEHFFFLAQTTTLLLLQLGFIHLWLISCVEASIFFLISLFKY